MKNKNKTTKLIDKNQQLNLENMWKRYFTDNISPLSI